MARNTHVMKKAQKQLDDVLGGERLPEHSDIDELPYITAIIKETFRWSPPVPIGTSHRLMEDDVYRGMFIPAGTTLLENIWLVHPPLKTGWLLMCCVGEYVMMRRFIQTRRRSTQTGSSVRMERSTHRSRIPR